MKDPDAPPPFWGAWRTIYIVVATALAVETALFWLLTKWAE